MLIDVLRLSNNAAVDKKLTSLAPFRQAVARARDDSRAFSLTTAVSTSSLQKMTACSIFSSSGKVKVNNLCLLQDSLQKTVSCQEVQLISLSISLFTMVAEE